MADLRERGDVKITVTRNIDKLANESSGWMDPKDVLRESFLDNRPTPQWPSFLDETAKDIVSNISVGDTGLDKVNFPREVGPLYRRTTKTASKE